MASTPGELIIEFFLKDEGIKFKREEEIPNLKGDYTPNNPRADFYLPKYKVFIEFLGKYRDKVVNARYKRKKDLYKQNNIPCIYIYPDNLGTLKYLFYIRLRDELKNHPELKRELFKYRLTTGGQLLSDLWTYFLISSLFILLLADLAQAKLVITPLVAISLLLILVIYLGLSIYVIKNIFSDK